MAFIANLVSISPQKGFNPLDRGNLYQIFFKGENNAKFYRRKFQSPRSGKFVSDEIIESEGKLLEFCFNPLDRGNLYQISYLSLLPKFENLTFQSPRSGKFVSDLMKPTTIVWLSLMFQSPRSGKFVSDLSRY